MLHGHDDLCNNDFHCKIASAHTTRLVTYRYDAEVTKQARLPFVTSILLLPFSLVIGAFRSYMGSSVEVIAKKVPSLI